MQHTTSIRLWVIVTAAWILVAAAIAPALVSAAPDPGDHTVYLTAQRFDHGVMYYRADTGTIWLLEDTGQVYHFSSSVYGALPDNPLYTVPAGRVRPINGFGRIWGNHVWVRTRFGWPVRAEFGFLGRIMTSGSSIYLVEFDQQIIRIEGNRWHYTSALPDPTPDATPTIHIFNAAPDPVKPGETITINWHLSGTDFALIEVYNSAGELVSYYNKVGLHSNATFVVPHTEHDHLRLVAWGVNYPPRFPSGTWGERAINAEIFVQVQPPNNPIEYTPAAFQQYAGGFMIWRADTGAVLAFSGSQGGNVYTFPESAYGSLPDNALNNPPSGFVAPVSGFGKVWGTHDWLRDQLGWATGPEQPYDMTIEGFPSASKQAFLLPEGRTAQVTRGHTWVIR